jgi:predicted molibdopterin-dependent oxidoreductase YjgC
LVEPGSPQLQRLNPRERGSPLSIDVDGDPIPCFAGETIAVAILAVRSWIGSDDVRRRGLNCGIGVCFECVVAVDGVPGTRACITLVREGMSVRTRLDPGIDA